MTQIDEIIEACKTIYDPEIPVNIYDLGLIYDIAIENNVAILTMTLTSPFCPVAEDIPLWVKSAVESVPSIEKANVTIVWEPPWGLDNISDEGKLTLGLL